MKAAIYARISTAAKLERQTPETQLLPLREFCARRGWEIAGEYMDDVSAVKNRPQFQKMLAEAWRKKIDVIVAVRLDRMFRSIADFFSIVGRLQSAGVRFICTDQPIDTDQKNAAGQLLMQIVAAVAEFERALISERVKAGIARAHANGKRWGGRKKKPIDVRRASELRRQGWTLEEISRTLDCNRNLLAKTLQSNEPKIVRGEDRL